MTKGNSVTSGTQYGNFVRGNRDKLMISYRRESSHDYSMRGTCGVLLEGEIHFFGGRDYGIGLDRQHFVIETQRSGQLVKITKKEDLEIGIQSASCSSFEITSEYFPWFKTNIAILCFDNYHTKSCYSFDDKLIYIGDSNFNHNFGGLTKYRENLLTIGGFSEGQKTEIMKKDENKTFNWSVVEAEFTFSRGDRVMYQHSLVTVESSDVNEEYVLLRVNSEKISISVMHSEKSLQDVSRVFGT